MVIIMQQTQESGGTQHVSSRTGFLNSDNTEPDVVEVGLCIGGCLAVALACTHQMPAAVCLVKSNQSISRHCQKPLGGKIGTCPGPHPVRTTLIPYGLEDMDWNGKVKTEGRQRGSILAEQITTLTKLGCQSTEMTFKIGSDLIGLAFQANCGDAGKAGWCGERLDATLLNFPPDTTAIALFCEHIMKFQNTVFINDGGMFLRIDLTLSQFNKALLCRTIIAHT